MKIAIDLDGTAWTHRELFNAIVRGLIFNGHEVGILTAHNEVLRDPDLDLWLARGFPKINFYIAKTTDEAGISSKEWKLDQMKKHNIDYLFDDFDTKEVRLIEKT